MMALKMTLLALPEEILLDILTALFQNAIIGITRPRCHVVKSDYENAIIGIARSRCHRLNIPQPFHRPNILQITVANKKLREMALGLLRDHKSSVSYRVNAIHADYANEPRYWSDTPFFANTINLAIFPSQFAILNKKRLQTSSDPDLRKIVMEWIYHDQNGSSRKYQRPNPGMDQVDFMYQLGTTIREVSARNLAYFLRRARRGNINGIVEVDVKWMGHVVSDCECARGLYLANEVTGMHSDGHDGESRCSRGCVCQQGDVGRPGRILLWSAADVLRAAWDADGSSRADGV